MLTLLCLMVKWLVQWFLCQGLQIMFARLRQHHKKDTFPALQQRSASLARNDASIAKSGAFKAVYAKCDCGATALVSQINFRTTSGRRKVYGWVSEIGTCGHDGSPVSNGAGCRICC